MDLHDDHFGYEGYETHEHPKFVSNFNKFLKKYPDEMRNIRESLHRTLGHYDETNMSLHQIAHGIGPFKCEFEDVFRLSEQGPGTGLTPVRLYLCVNKEKKSINFLCLGTKQSQPEDISHCKKERKKIEEEVENAK